MEKGGSLMTLSFYGAEKVVGHYNIMGRVKAALEASVRCLAQAPAQADSCQCNFCGAVVTRAACGIEHFDELLNETVRKAPLRRTVEAAKVGRAALMLASDYATAITDELLHVDGGFHIKGIVFHSR